MCGPHVPWSAQQLALLKSMMPQVTEQSITRPELLKQLNALPGPPLKLHHLVYRIKVEEGSKTNSHAIENSAEFRDQEEEEESEEQEEAEKDDFDQYVNDREKGLVDVRGGVRWARSQVAIMRDLWPRIMNGSISHEEVLEKVNAVPAPAKCVTMVTLRSKIAQWKRHASWKAAHESDDDGSSIATPGTADPVRNQGQLQHPEIVASPSGTTTELKVPVHHYLDNAAVTLFFRSMESAGAKDTPTSQQTTRSSIDTNGSSCGPAPKKQKLNDGEERTVTTGHTENATLSVSGAGNQNISEPAAVGNAEQVATPRKATPSKAAAFSTEKEETAITKYLKTIARKRKDMMHLYQTATEEIADVKAQRDVALAEKDKFLNLSLKYLEQWKDAADTVTSLRAELDEMQNQRNVASEQARLERGSQASIASEDLKEARRAYDENVAQIQFEHSLEIKRLERQGDYIQREFEAAMAEHQPSLEELKEWWRKGMDMKLSSPAIKEWIGQASKWLC